MKVDGPDGKPSTVSARCRVERETTTNRYSSDTANRVENENVGGGSRVCERAVLSDDFHHPEMASLPAFLRTYFFGSVYNPGPVAKPGSQPSEESQYRRCIRTSVINVFRRDR